MYSGYSEFVHLFSIAWKSWVFYDVVGNNYLLLVTFIAMIKAYSAATRIEHKSRKIIHGSAHIDL